jgi:hypothetical protein
MAALCVCEGLFLAQPLLRVKESCTAAAGFAHSAAHLSFGRLAGLGTSGWRGSLSAEGVKSSVQLVTAKRCSSGTGRPVFIDKVYLHAQTPGRRLRRLHKIATAIMTKRKRLGDDEQKCRSKRIRSETFSQLELSKLSDELVLKILTYLPIEDLAVAQRYVSSPPLTIGLTDTE